MRVLLLGGLVGPLCFVSAVLLGAWLRPDYDHSMEVMSALGATGSPNAMLMNGGGFLPTGFMILAFGVGLRRFVPSSILAIVGTALILIFGSGIVGAGVYSCDPGCVGVGTSREAHLHIVASAIAFLSGISACFAWGGAFRSNPLWRPLSNYSLWTGIVSMGLLTAFNSSTDTGAYPGLWQRLFITSLFVWCAIVGVYGFRISAKGTDDARG